MLIRPLIRGIRRQTYCSQLKEHAKKVHIHYLGLKEVILG